MDADCVSLFHHCVVEHAVLARPFFRLSEEKGTVWLISEKRNVQSPYLQTEMMKVKNQKNWWIEYRHWSFWSFWVSRVLAKTFSVITTLWSNSYCSLWKVTVWGWTKVWSNAYIQFIDKWGHTECVPAWFPPILVLNSTRSAEKGKIGYIGWVGTCNSTPSSGNLFLLSAHCRRRACVINGQ